MAQANLRGSIFLIRTTPLWALKDHFSYPITSFAPHTNFTTGNSKIKMTNFKKLKTQLTKLKSQI